jgi:NAD(P)-dependent dehydrogenase (short-subunit alcohol dehydrogenase family)
MASISRRTLAPHRLGGAFLGCRHVMALLKRNGGAIVSIASVCGLVGDANLAAYSASKGGLRLLTKSVALHGATLKPPVRCNVVCPAYLDGSMVEGVFAGLLYPVLARQVMTGRGLGLRLSTLRRLRLCNRRRFSGRRRPDGALTTQRQKRPRSQPCSSPPHNS